MEKKVNMLTYNFENIGSDTLYEYLYKCIKNDIIQGKIKSGEKLPSKRALAKNLTIGILDSDHTYGQIFCKCTLRWKFFSTFKSPFLY